MRARGWSLKWVSGLVPPTPVSWVRQASHAGSAALPAWRQVVAGAALHGIPTPAFSSSLAYYDGVRAERLPAALIQGQRDFFGAHTYRRVDKPGTFHTEWSGDRTETAIDGGPAQTLPPEPAEKADPTPA